MKTAPEKQLWNEVVEEVLDELDRAAGLGFGPARSAHEGYAVFLEEADELKAEVWKNQKARDPEKLRREAVQAAAMAIRLAAQTRRPGWVRR